MTTQQWLGVALMGTIFIVVGVMIARWPWTDDHKRKSRRRHWR